MVEVGLTNATDTAFREENTNEGGIVTSGPILDRECQWIGVMFRWIREFQVSVNRNLSDKLVGILVVQIPRILRHQYSL